MDLTFIFCDYLAPELGNNLIKNIRKFHSEEPIIAAATNEKVDWDLLESDEKTTWVSLPATTHGEGVNLLIQKVKTKYALLLDSDVFLLKPITEIYDKVSKHKLDMAGKVVGDVAGKRLYPRVEPWFCFLNAEKINRHKLRFFDKVRTKDSKQTNRVYDIGSTLFEDMKEGWFPVGDIDCNEKYYRHYGGMSWHTTKFDPTQGDTDIDLGGTHPHKGLYDHGLKVKEKYLTDAKVLC
jgi:hypothetical protein